MFHNEATAPASTMIRETRSHQDRSRIGTSATEPETPTIGRADQWTVRMYLDTFPGDSVNETLFKDVFRDALVIDLDFSNWDRVIRMVVVAREATAFPKRRLPIYVVEFQRVSSLDIRFAYHGISPDFGHCQWDIDVLDLVTLDGMIRVRFSERPQMPITTIQCEDIDIRGLDNGALGKRFPGWSQPGSPFVRPGVEELIKEDVCPK